MKIIGITGGIGTGKTTVCNILKEFGTKNIDADELARKAVQKGESTLNELIVTFGNDILDENGELKRKELAEIVFKNPDKLFILTDIVHKWVYENMRKQIEEYRDDNYDGIIVIDIPLPTQRFRKLFDELWVIDSELEKRIERVMKRNNCTKEEVLDRINNQMQQEEYIKLADRVILNNESEEELRERLEQLFYIIKEMDY